MRKDKVISFRMEQEEYDYYKKLAVSMNITSFTDFIMQTLREKYKPPMIDPDPDMYWYGHA